LTLIDSEGEDVPFHSVREDLANYKLDHSHRGETAAERRRRLADGDVSGSSTDDPTTDEETPAELRRRLEALEGPTSPAREGTSGLKASLKGPKSHMDEGETAAERKRRLGALGMGEDDYPDSDSDEEEGGDPLATGRGTHHRSAGGNGAQQQSATQVGGRPRAPGIRFAEQPRIPTKDERAAEEKEDVASGSGGKLGLGKLKWRK
jgi:hypothetical protein